MLPAYSSLLMFFCDSESDSPHQDRIVFFVGLSLGTAVVKLEAVGIVVQAAHRNPHSRWLVAYFHHALQTTAISAFGLDLLNEFSYFEFDLIHTAS